MFLLIPTGIDHRFRRAPLLTFVLALGIGLAFVLKQLYPQHDSLQGWLAALAIAGGGRVAAFFSPGSAVLVALSLLMLALVASPLEDALGRVRFALIYVLGACSALGLHTLLARPLGVEPATLGPVVQGGAISIFLGVALVRLYGLQVRAAYLFVAPRTAHSDVFRLPVLALALLWFILPAALAASHNFPRESVLGLAVNGVTMILGSLLALALGFERERLIETNEQEGLMLRTTGSPHAAAEYLQRVLATRNGDPVLHAELAECYVEIGRSIEAARHFAKAMQEFADREEHILAGQTYLRFRHLLPAGKMSPDLELRMASILSSLKWHDDALAALSLVAHKAGDSSAGQNAVLQAADTYSRLGQPDRGLALLRRARLRYAHAEAVAAIDDGIRRLARTVDSPPH